MTTRPAHAGTMLAIDALLYLIVHLLAGVHAVRASVCGRLQSERRCVLAKPVGTRVRIDTATVFRGKAFIEHV